MRKLIQVLPLACESLGTRSSCHLVITTDTIILVDASVSLGPRRYGLPPHPKEVAISYLSRQIILAAATIANHVTVTHYHADHYSLPWPRAYEFSNKEIATTIYSNKIVWAKKTDTVNYSQRKRAYWLWKNELLDVRPADGNSFSVGDTEVRFSAPLYHGTSETKMGTVVALSISDGNRKWLYTSDVSGPGHHEVLEFIQQESPDYVLIDGPAVYHPRIQEEEIVQSLRNLRQVYDLVPTVIIEHHFLRTSDWEKILKEKVGIDPKKIFSLADLVKAPRTLLEVDRKQLHRQSPPSKEFYENLKTPTREFKEQLELIARDLPASGYLLDKVMREIQKHQLGEENLYIDER